jgi:hypothetical protein
VAQDEGRALQALDDVGHRKSLSGTRDSQERYVINALADCIAQPVNGLGLVAGGLVVGMEPEIHSKTCLLQR